MLLSWILDSFSYSIWSSNSTGGDLGSSFLCSIIKTMTPSDHWSILRWKLRFNIGSSDEIIHVFAPFREISVISLWKVWMLHSCEKEAFLLASNKYVPGSLCPTPSLLLRERGGGISAQALVHDGPAGVGRALTRTRRFPTFLCPQSALWLRRRRKALGALA